MIEIKVNNKFKIVDASKLRNLSEGDSVLLGEYNCFYNTALGGIWCHNKSFGDKDDYEYGSFNSMTSQFFVDKGYVSVSCSALGDVCSFTFSERDVEKAESLVDEQCMNYTIDYLKHLYKEGIIEKPDQEAL